MDIAITSLFILVLIAGWVLTLIGLPGNWLMVAAAAGVAFWMPAEQRTDLSTTTLGILLGLALVGELIEFLAAAGGAKKAGGSMRGTVGAIVGSIAGAILGLVVGVPIPVVGSLVSAVLFSAVGAFFGALWAEKTTGRPQEEVMTVGRAAFWGRLWGSVAKIGIGTLIALTCIAALLIK